MLKSIIEILLIIVDNILLVKLLHVFCKPKKNNNKNSISMIIILIFENLLLYNVIKINHLVSFVPVITLILYSFPFLTGTVFKKIGSVILTFVNIMIVNGLFIMIGLIFNPSMYTIVFDNNSNLAYPLSIVNKLLIFLEYQYLKNFYHTELELTPNTWKFILTILTVSIFAIDLSLNEYTKRNASTIYTSITIITFILLNILVFWLCLTISRQSIEKENQDIFLESLKYEEKILAVANKMTQELRSANHDFKHHMGVVRKMVREGNPEITDYLNNLSMIADNPDNLIHTNNPVLNYILNDKIEIASVFNIKVDHTLTGVDINNIDLKYINNIDLSIIIGNLFDNAIESCNQVSGEKFINIEVSMNENKTVFIIENSTLIEKMTINYKLSTTKIRKEHHGYGMNSVKNSVSRYSGELIYYVENHVFTCKCIIPNMKNINSYLGQ